MTDGATRALRDAMTRGVRERLILADIRGHRARRCDGLTAYRTVPRLVVLPGTAEQAAHVLATCHGTRRAGGRARETGTGLSGGAMPRADGVVLSLRQSSTASHIGIDPQNRYRARAQPGVRNGLHDVRAGRRAAAVRACITRRTVLAGSPARSAATSPRTPAACALPEIRADRAQHRRLTC